MTQLGSKYKQLRILIVDDDALMRGYLKTALQRVTEGVVLEVAKADEVIDACRRHRPSIVFLDIDLGGRNGLELIKGIMGQRSDTYIIMVSAHSTLENAKRALEDGARGFIVKPFTMAKIMAALTRALNQLSADKGRVKDAAVVVEANQDPEAGSHNSGAREGEEIDRTGTSEGT